MILVVDDHADTRQTMIRLFKVHDLPARGAADGREALSVLHAQRPGIVLLDYNMPGMNGLEVLEVIRGTEQLKDLPVIMFSAMSNNIEQQARALGVDEYIRKCEFDWPWLVERVRKYVNVEAACHPARQRGSAQAGNADAR